MIKFYKQQDDRIAVITNAGHEYLEHGALIGMAHGDETISLIDPRFLETTRRMALVDAEALETVLAFVAEARLDTATLAHIHGQHILEALITVENANDEAHDRAGKDDA